MRSRKSRRAEWTTTKRGRIVHLAASPPQSLRDYINRARTTSPSATRMSHKDWTNFGGQLTPPSPVHCAVLEGNIPWAGNIPFPFLVVLANGAHLNPSFALHLASRWMHARMA